VIKTLKRHRPRLLSKIGALQIPENLCNLVYHATSCCEFVFLWFCFVCLFICLFVFKQIAKDNNDHRLYLEVTVFRTIRAPNYAEIKHSCQYWRDIFRKARKTGEEKSAPDSKCEKGEESVSGVSQSTMWAIFNFCAFAGLLFGFLTAVSPPKYFKCISKDFGHGGTVCVCSEQFCDSFTWGERPLSAQEYAVYTSSKAGDRFSLKTGRFNKTLGVKSSQKTIKLAVNKTVTFQKILGFGGAFTG